MLQDDLRRRLSQGGLAGCHIGCLCVQEESAAANLAKLAALEHINQLDHEAASLAEELATTILAALCACDREAAKLQVKDTAAASAAAEARSVANEKQSQLELAQKHLAAVRLEHKCRQIGRQELLKLQQDVAAAEENMQLLLQQQASRSKLAAQLEAVNGKLLLLKARHAEALAKLEHCRKRHLSITSSHSLSASASASTAELQALLSHEVQLLQAAVKGQQLALSQNALAVDEQSSHMEQLLDEQRSLESDLAHLSESPPCPAQAGDEQLVAGLQQRLAVLQQEERLVGHQAGILAARLGSSGGHRGWRFLHECFSFKEPQQCQQYATALQLLTEGKLSIVVADDTTVAGQMLAAGSTARIWPLDVLEARNFTAQQQAAAANFSNGLCATKFATPSTSLHGQHLFVAACR
jgi:chromosome segregation ATPase